MAAIKTITFLTLEKITENHEHTVKWLCRGCFCGDSGSTNNIKPSPALLLNALELCLLKMYSHIQTQNLNEMDINILKKSSIVILFPI